MERYKIVFKKSVYKDLSRSSKCVIKRILARIDSLVDNPRPRGAEKLTKDEKYRIRQGNYRILYTVEDTIITVTIVKVAHRLRYIANKESGRFA